jgi:soluble lytic murein transglycosylase-like protein
MIPLAVLLFVTLIGGLVAQLMLQIELPHVSPNPPPAQPAAPSPAISPLFTPEVRYWNDNIVRWAKDYDLDPNLVATVMQIESCGNPEAVSSSNAQGLFQVMPFHFAEGENMRDPDTNARRGLAYLSRGLALSGDHAGLALAGYNGGHSQIAKAWSRWPNETQRYFYWGSGIYAEASAGAESSSRLAEWLKAGGAGMCARAHQQLGLP